MQFSHTNKNLKKIDEEPDFLGGFSPGVVKAFRLRMQFIRGAFNENDLRKMKSYRFEKLKGDREGDYSIRLNDQFRLTFQIEKADDGNRLIVLNIEDYH